MLLPVNMTYHLSPKKIRPERLETSFGAFRYYVQHPVIFNRKCSTTLSAINHQTIMLRKCHKHSAEISDVLASISKHIEDITPIKTYANHLKASLCSCMSSSGSRTIPRSSIDWIHQASTITNPSSDLRALRALSAVLQGLALESIWPPLKQHTWHILISYVYTFTRMMHETDSICVY